jgi:uncharacterized Zn-finger protein
VKTQNAVELLAEDLDRAGETCCPNPKAGMKRWNTHPRVYLRFTNGEAKCPYCGTVYVLRDKNAAVPHH